jgi:FkbM family methyltransferase
MQSENLVPWGAAPSNALADWCIEVAKRRWVRGGIRRFLLNTFATSDDVRDVVVDGFKLRCHYADNDTERDLCIDGAAKHASEMSMLMSYLQPGDSFVDVGANCGWFTLNAARKVGSSGRVVAIEPLPEMFGRLCFNISANGFQNVVTINAALASESGTLVLNVNDKQRGMSGAHPACGSRTIEVRSRSLPQILDELPRGCALLKIDVEGYEDRVLLPILSGADPDLWPRKIFMETRHSDRWESDCVKMLCQHGYSVIWQAKGDALLSVTS